MGREKSLLESFKILEKKKRKLELKQPGKVVRSKSSKKSAGGALSNQSGNDTKSRDRADCGKNDCTKVAEKQSSVVLQGKKSPLITFKDNGEDMNGNLDIKKLKKRRKQKKPKNHVVLDEASRLQRRSRYLLIKVKLEQNLIDAYSGEGWKGQSREKIRPEKELQRARKQILKCKLGIREAIHQLELLSSSGSIEDAPPDGSVHHEQIICAKCKLREAFPDNDIILCDGTCNRAFHQECLDPPLTTDNIPPGDQGWFCKLCMCKMDMVEAMNAHLGTDFSVNSTWQDFFKDEAALADGSGTLTNLEEEWPSDDSEDDDYDPEKNEPSCSVRADREDGGASVDSSTSGSLSWSFEEEAFSGLMESGKRRKLSHNSTDLISSAESEETNQGKLILGPRQRRAVDYKKLYDEMFGKDAPGNEQMSEDEDWGPGRKKRKEKDSDAASTLMTLFDSETNVPNAETNVKEDLPVEPHSKRSLFRLPPNAVEKLRQVFAENELPSKAVRDDLSKELGLTSEKVNKWFKNARYLALKVRKAGTTVKLHNPTTTVSKETEPKTEETRMPVVEVSKESSATLHGKPKKHKKADRTKSSKPIVNLSKKKQRRGVLESCINNNEVLMEFSDDLSLKVQMQLLKAKSKKKKKLIKLKPQTGSRTAEIEMERLCRIKCRLENMKNTVSRLNIPKTRYSDKAASNQQSVVYFPVAELREKL